MRIRELREKARQTLEGNWWRMFGIYLLVQVAIVVVGIVSVSLTSAISAVFAMVNPILAEICGIILIIAAIIVILDVTVALNYGFIITVMELGKGEPVGFKQCFSDGIKNFKRAWNVFDAVLLKLLPWILLLLGSYIIMIFGTVARIIMLIGFVVLIFAVIKIVKVSLACAFSYFLAVDAPDKSGNEVVQKSIELMEGNKAKMFVLPITFVGWSLLAGLPKILGDVVTNLIWPPVLLLSNMISTAPAPVTLLVSLLSLIANFVIIYCVVTTYHFYKEQNPEECFDENYEKPVTDSKRYIKIMWIIVAVIVFAPILFAGVSGLIMSILLSSRFSG